MKKKLPKPSTLPEVAVVEVSLPPNLTEGQTPSLERDRDRANRLYNEVHHLAEQLGEERAKSNPKDWDGSDLSHDELVKRILPGTFQPAPEGLTAVADMDPERITHRDIAQLDDTKGPAAGDEQWERIRAAAESDLIGGHQARKAITHDFECNATPYQDLTFRTTYDLLRKEWEPKGMSELLIIQHMVQAHTAAQFWFQRLTRYSCGMATTVKDEDDRAKYGEWVPPRVSAAETVDFCSRQIVRFTNLYLKQVRALRDLRRYSVTINNLGQVNIADKQINSVNDS